MSSTMLSQYSLQPSFVGTFHDQSNISHNHRQLMEIDLEIEVLRSMLEKNIAYGNKLRASAQKIQARRNQNIESLTRLLAQQHSQSNNNNNDSNNKRSNNINTQGNKRTRKENCLHGHRIQSIPFFAFETYHRIDCIQAFELMPRKSVKTSRLFSSSNQSYLNSSMMLSTDISKSTSTENIPESFDRFLKQQQTTITPARFRKDLCTLIIVSALAGELDQNGFKFDTLPASRNTTSQTLMNLNDLNDISYSIDWIRLSSIANAIVRLINLKQNKRNNMSSELQGITSSHIEAIELFNAFKSITSSISMSEIRECIAPIDSSKRNIIVEKLITLLSRQSSSSSSQQSIASSNNKSGASTSNTSNNSQSVNNSNWLAVEDEMLLQSVGVFGTKRWGQVATQLNGRDHTEIVQRYVKVLRPNVEKGRWSLSEDLALAILIEYFTKSRNNSSPSDMRMEEQSPEKSTHEEDSNKTWCLIAGLFKKRTEVQIRERWCNLLDPKNKFTDWTRSEDSLVLSMIATHPGQWAYIARKLENKTDNQVLRRAKLLLSDAYGIEQLQEKYPTLKSENVAISTNSVITNKKMKPIFQLIRLPIGLADLIRKDNASRKIKKRKVPSSNKKKSNQVIKKIAVQKKRVATNSKSLEPQLKKKIQQTRPRLMTLTDTSEVDFTTTFRLYGDDRSSDDADSDSSVSSSSPVDFTEFESSYCQQVTSSASQRFFTLKSNPQADNIHGLEMKMSENKKVAIINNQTLKTSNNNSMIFEIEDDEEKVLPAPLALPQQPVFSFM